MFFAGPRLWVAAVLFHELGALLFDHTEVDLFHTYSKQKNTTNIVAEHSLTVSLVVHRQEMQGLMLQLGHSGPVSALRFTPACLSIDIDRWTKGTGVSGAADIMRKIQGMWLVISCIAGMVGFFVSAPLLHTRTTVPGVGMIKSVPEVLSPITRIDHDAVHIVA